MRTILWIFLYLTIIFAPAILCYSIAVATLEPPYGNVSPMGTNPDMSAEETARLKKRYEEINNLRARAMESQTVASYKSPLAFAWFGIGAGVGLIVCAIITGTRLE